MFAFLKTQISSSIKYIAIAILVAFLLYFIYSSIYDRGYAAGQQSIQSEWDSTKEAHRQEIEKLTQEYDNKEQVHREANTQIMQDLADVRREYESNTALLTGSYEYKLLQSENRASVYQRQAESGASECRSLASHATRLDRTITEGIKLVRELTETLRLREQQLVLLGQQINNDRKLLNE